LIAAVLGKSAAPKVTIGTDPGTAAAVNQTGSCHVDCPVREFVVDKDHKIVTTPAYMLAQSISEAAEGIEKAVKAVIEMT
jgi:enhancing lycopene biosynthesis protein 2